MGKKATFECLSPMIEREINLIKESSIFKIKRMKENTNQINHLHQEIRYRRIEEQIHSEAIKRRIESLNKKIYRQYLCRTS